MVENALGGAGAAIALGLELETVREGLKSFRSDTRSNVGRLNVFRLDGRIVIVDYAHNESGLEALIEFARGLMGGEGRLHAIIGTAGDRQDSVLNGLGRIAAERSDAIFVKENVKYLRGRERHEQIDCMVEGIEAAGGLAKLAGTFDGEHSAVVAAIERSQPGDAIAVMCVEEQLGVLRELRDRGASEWEA
jgi:cyanophycin synthetase